MQSISADSAMRAVHGIQGGPSARQRSPSHGGEKRVGFADGLEPSSSKQLGERKVDADGPITGRPGVIRICVPSQVRHSEVPSSEGAACGSSETVDLAVNTQQDNHESIDDFMRRTEFELFGPRQCCGSGEMSGALSVQPSERAGAGAGAPAASTGDSAAPEVLRPLSLSSTAIDDDEHPGRDAGCNLKGERARGASTTSGATAEHVLQSPSGSDVSTGSSVASILRLQPADARGSDHLKGSDQASQATMRSISQSLTSARIAVLGDGRDRSSQHRPGSNGAVLESRIESGQCVLRPDDRYNLMQSEEGQIFEAAARAASGAGLASARGRGQPSTGHGTKWTVHSSGPGGVVCASGNTVGERDLTAASEDKGEDGEEDEEAEADLGLDGFESDSGVYSD